MIRPTKTGALFLGVSVLFYLASVTSQSGLLLLLIGIIAGGFVVNLVAAWQSVRRLEIHPPRNAHLSEGQKMTQSWRITNRGSRPVGFVQVESAEGTLFRLATLPAKAEANVVPELIYWQRGVFAWSQVRLTSTFPFGLLRVTRRLQLPGEVVVCPAIYPAPAPRAAGYDVVVGGKFKGQHRSQSGSHFAGVRPLQPGDPLKQIHWRSSSKGLGLMVKTFDEELSGRVAILMDCGHSGDVKCLDDCVRAAGSLIFAALEAGHHVEWIDLGHHERLVLSPFDDGQEILDRLARIHLTPNSLTVAAMQAAVGQVSRKSALNFVLTDANAAIWEAVDALRSQGRHVAVYLPDSRRQPAGQSDTPVFTYGERELRPRP